MLPKPDTCKGCPFYDNGIGFVPDEIVDGARVTIVAQNPGKDEEAQGKPMVGKTGQALDATYLPIAGLQRGYNVNVRNVLKCRWTLPNGKRTDNLPTGVTLEQAVEHCGRHYLSDLPDSVDHLVIAMGDLSWSALGGPDSITKRRGFLVQLENPFK